LKLGNFLINTVGDKLTVVLVDLDFLCRANSTPNSNVFGTPGHIAPEILANERVVSQSDNYSLGVSLRNCLEGIASPPPHQSCASASLKERLGEFISILVERDYLRRPRSLVDALYRYGVFDSDAFGIAQKTLLSMVLLSHFRASRNRNLGTPEGLKKFLRDKCRILGLHDDLIGEIAAVYSQSKRAAWGIFKTLLMDASLDCHADFWHLSLSDEDLYKAYSSLERYGGSRASLTVVKEAYIEADMFRCLHNARELRERGRLEQPYLMLTSLLEHVSTSESERSKAGMESTLAELGALAQSLNRLDESDQYLSQLLALLEKKPCSTLQLLYVLSSVNIKLGRFEKATDFVRRGLKEAGETCVNRHTLSLLQAEAWLDMTNGKYEKAEKTLSSVIESAVELKLYDIVVTAQYVVGVLFLQRGDSVRAVHDLLKSFKLAQDKHMLPQSIAVISTLSWLYSELAEYQKSVEFGKLAIKFATDPRHISALPSAYQAITFAYYRLAEYQKAEYWLQCYLDLGLQENSRRRLAYYYIQDGLIKVNKGDLTHAIESWYKTLELVEASSSPQLVGKTYHNLAEVALYRGDVDECDSYVEKAKSIYSDVGDEGSVAELDLFALLKDCYYENLDRSAQLLSQVKLLITRGCPYYAVLCIFHLLLRMENQRHAQIVEVARPLLKLITQSKTPLFRATDCLVQCAERNELERRLEVTAWKEAFKILLNANSKFLAMLVGIKVARFYSESAKSKHAQKFLRQSLRLAEDLSNSRMIESIKEELQVVSRTADSQVCLIDSFHGISLILKDATNYEESLRQLIHFAVEQTGAERGVLLLKSKDSPELRIGASVNCDDSSLSDITDFSRTVAAASSREPWTLLIDNALEDRRTNKYKSVVFHNILSVVCVPLTDGEETLGVLYIDHHTIPSLFEKEDLTYILSIANFTTVTLRTLQDYKSLSLTNTQLLQDLNRSGDQCSFITKDTSMLRMFEKLPQIARTNTSILIFGESGTGKEILCNVIHSLSLRCGQPLIKLNCAAIASTMIESELFGVARGAATGVAEREGKFAAADQGTLFLDEIGNMPLEIQAKVLRLVENQRFEKVGSNRPIFSDVRFIYATNQNLLRMVEQGKFREDLFYRINTITIEIPPLRERPDDIPLLIEHFVRTFSVGKKAPRFTTDALGVLVAYLWPGNVRQLKNFVEQCCILHPGAQLNVTMLPTEMQDSGATNLRSKETAVAAEVARIREVLIKSQWNQSQAARLLDMPLSTLRRKIKKYSIQKQV